MQYDLIPAEKSFAEFRLLAETIPQLVWISWSDGSIEYVNQRWHKYVGAPPGSCYRENRLKYYHEDDRKEIQRCWQDAQQNGQAYETEGRIRSGKTGEYRWFLERAVPQFNTQGQIMRWFGTCTDIDEKKRAGEALRQSRDEFRSLVEALPQLVWIMSTSGREEYVNQRWFDYTHATANDIRGEGWLSLLHPDDQRGTQHLWREALRTRQPYEARYRLRNAQTETYEWFLGRAVPLFNDEGEVVKWFGTSTNINQEKQREEALRTSMDEFRLLAEMIPQLVWVDNPDGSGDFANQRWYEYFDMTEDQRDNWLSVYHPDDRPKIEALWNTSLLTTRPHEAEARLRNGKTGEYRWFLIRGVPLLNEYGRVIKWFGTCTDIHEKKRKEETMHISNQRFKKLFASDFIGIAISDLQGNCRDANEAFLRLVGYTREDLLAGKIHWRKLAANEKIYETDRASLQRLRAVGYAPPGERELVRKDGSRLWFFLGSVMLDRSEDTTITFALDIQQRKEFDQRKDDFIGIAGHELKTPLAGLKLLSQYIRRKLKKGALVDADKYLAQMGTEVDNLARLVNDFLDVSRIQAGRLIYRDELFDFDALVQEVVEGVQQTSPTHTISLQGTSGQQYRGDRYRIGEVLANLLGNAIKYSPLAQNVEVSIQKCPDNIAVSVRDFGVGIAKEEQTRIFERFYRVSARKNRGTTGLGMGLYISGEIIKHYNGEIRIESTEGEGATFTMVLPEQREEPSL